jgi:hypothetical protein
VLYWFATLQLPGWTVPNPFASLLGIDPQEFVGWMALMGMQLPDDPAKLYTVDLNISTGKIVVFANEAEVKATATYKPITTTAGTTPPLTPRYTYNWVTDGQISVVNNSYFYDYVIAKNNSEALVVQQIDRSNKAVIKTWTLTIDEALKQRIIDIASAQPEMTPLIAQGVQFIDFRITFSTGRSQSPVVVDGVQFYDEEVHFMAYVILASGNRIYNLDVPLDDFNSFFLIPLFEYSGNAIPKVGMGYIPF